MEAEKMKEMAENAARYMRARGYSAVEVKGGEVHAETEVQLGDWTYAFPVVLTLGEDAWTYEVEKAGRFGDMFEVAPGGLATPELARSIVKGWWRTEGLDDEYEIWRELSAERLPGEALPTEEEVRAALENYRRRLTAEAARAEAEEGWFVVKPDNGGRS